MAAVALELVGAALPLPPYPADSRAGNYPIALDVGRIIQSDTWTLAADDLRPWLLQLWCLSWLQIPMGSLPDDDAMIPAILRMSPAVFQAHRATIMRGWRRHSDGRLYHNHLTGIVLAVLRQRARYTRHRQSEKEAAQANDSQGSNVVTPLPQRAVVDVVVVGSTKNKDRPVESKAEKKARATKLELEDLPDAWMAYAQAVHPDWSKQGVYREWLTFRNYWRAKPKDNTKLDWPATWENWIRRANEEPKR